MTPTLLATTFIAQGLLAGFLPPAAVITKQGIRLPKQTRIAESLLGTLLVFFLAARWLLPARGLCSGANARWLDLLGSQVEYLSYCVHDK